MRYGYFGPAGTFTQAALLAWRPAEGADHVPFPTVDAALRGVQSGEVDSAMVPIENSIEGGVPATIDALNALQLVIVGEVLVPITFVLVAPPGTTLADVRTIGTHSHAWAQVRGWASEHLPGVTYVPALSTAAGPQALAAAVAAGEPTPYDAAVCAPVAAGGLSVLAEDIGDNKSAVTRFVLVARPGWLPRPTGFDKTTLVLYQYSDRAGGLLDLLEQFATRGINLTRLESRPTGEAMGSYCFSVDLEGHLRDARVADALLGLRRTAADVRFLGSYPRADLRTATVDPSASDEAFAAARDWLQSLG